MKHNLDAPRLILLILLCSGWAGATALRAQEGRGLFEGEKQERAETQRLAASSKAEDRSEAVARLASSFMDYRLLWTLMNDTDPGVRVMAIGGMTWPSCTTVAVEPLSAGLAQKMATMLEKEVTQERIRAAFAPGPKRDAAANLATTSAVTLNHLYRFHSPLKSPTDYITWQHRVLRPLLFAAASGSPSSADTLHGCAMELFSILSEPTLLLEALPVILKKLDDPALPAERLWRTLEALWSHTLLGNGQPLNLLLLAQLAPRLEALRPRILSPMKEGLQKEQAARLIKEIAEAIQTARERMGTSQQRQAAPFSVQADSTAPPSADKTPQPKAPSPPPPPPSQEQQQPLQRAEILRQAGSSEASGRAYAIYLLVSRDMDYDLFLKLMNDPDRDVRLTAFLALDNFCSDKGSSIPLEMARKMAALLEQEVTDERIQAAFHGKDSRKEEKDAITQLYASALALNHLYQTTALETPDACKHWQERVLKFLVICLANHRDAHGYVHEEYLYELLQLISDPYVLSQALQFTLENLDDLPTARQLTALEDLWAHPLLGAGKPLNLVLLQSLAPVWEPVRDHILRNLKDKDLKERTTALLTRIDTALAQARKQLSEQPAKATQP